MLDHRAQYQHLLDMRYRLAQLFHQYEVHDSMFTWRWWLLVVMTVLPWWIWWLFRDKERGQETLLFGLLVGAAAVVLDCYGTSFVWWSYPVKVVQGIPVFLTADLTVVPVCMMLAYQKCKSLCMFLIVNTIVAFGIAYVGEPICMLFGYYHLYAWRLTYSFVFYLLAGPFCWFIVRVHSASSTFPKKSTD